MINAWSARLALGIRKSIKLRWRGTVKFFKWLKSYPSWMWAAIILLAAILAGLRGSPHIT